jgi:hypothetical protein
MKTNLFDFEIPEGGQWSDEYKTNICEECGSFWREWRGLKREHLFFTADGKYGYAALRCKRCGHSQAYYRVRIRCPEAIIGLD